jgi:hypothetical protein
VSCGAHAAVARAIRLGELSSRPCEECGEPKTVAHHDDYERPLDVRWLCHSHHRRWHAANGPGLNRGPKRQWRRSRAAVQLGRILGVRISEPAETAKGAA